MGERIAVDIDGVLTHESDGFGEEIYRNRKPRVKVIAKVNKWKEEGHTIILFSARHEEDREVTLEWLKKHNVKFDELVLDKVKYDLIIDDKATMDMEDFLYF